MARSLLPLVPAVALFFACTLRPSSLPPPEVEPSFFSDPQLLEEFRTITSKLRGLEFRNATPMAEMDSETLARKVDRGVDKALPPAELERLRLKLLAFGLISEEFDLRAYVKALNTDQLVGYYDSQKNRLILLQDGGAATPSKTAAATPVAQAQPTQRAQPVLSATPVTNEGQPPDSRTITKEELSLVHELVHTLQDQNLVELHEFLHPSGGLLTGEERMARRALLEGDATFVMTQFYLGAEHDLSRQNDAGGRAFDALRQKMVSLAPELGSGPRFLLDQMLFPYLYGMDFASRLLRERGWEVVNAAYRWPPASTEHIFHPVKYLEGERPHKVSLSAIPALEPLGYVPAGEGVWGELGIRSYLATVKGWDGAAEAAAGWGGDRFRIYLKPGRLPLAIWATSWDTQSDAEEFETALELCREAQNPLPSHLVRERRGKVVLVLVGGVLEPEVEPASLWGAISVERFSSESPPFVSDLLR